MGIKRVIDVTFWTDAKTDEFSAEDRYFYLYLLTNPQSTQLGIYELSIKQAAFQLGYSIECVKVLLDRFESKYHMIIYNKETNEIAILNYLRHSIIKGGKPVEDCLIREMAKVKDINLLEAVINHLTNKTIENDTVLKFINLVKEYLELSKK